MAIHNSRFTIHKLLGQLPWLIGIVLILILFLLMRVGWWRSSGVGSQVQVPMFYDAHYLFPRPWTQEQAAPGVPDPAMLAFYGPNRISQSFVGSADMLSMVELWLAGAEGTEVSVSLADDRGRIVSTNVLLTNGREGGPYFFSFDPFSEAKGEQFQLTLYAASANVDQPVITRTVGGDRLRGSLRLNEYNRPGNLAVKMYASGWPGKWWFEALSEQLLPAPFLLRLQQYKPPLFKGAVFPFLLALTAVATVLYLVLARPMAGSSVQSVSGALGWTIVLILTLFLIWQMASGRMRLVALTKSTTMELSEEGIAIAPPAETPSRLMIDLASDLWTAQREPEARFVSSDLVEGLPAIRVPANSRLEYGFFVPPDASLRSGIAAAGEESLRAIVRVGDDVVYAEEVEATVDAGKERISWIEIDLSPWSGQGIFLSLIMEGKESGADGLWVMPQIESNSSWLLPDSSAQLMELSPAGFRFGNTAELLGFSVEPPVLKAGEAATVKLYWRPLQASDDYATVFVHLLDDQGQLVAQHDAQPVNNAYPVSVWQPGTIVVDEHTFDLPVGLAGDRFSLAVGLYDPDTLERWPVLGPDNAPIGEERALLSTSLEVAP